jgi:hypothetical protein
MLRPLERANLNHWTNHVKVKVTLRSTVSRPVCPGIRPQSGPVTNISFCSKLFLDNLGFVILWRPFWREGRSVIYCCSLASPAQSLSVWVTWDTRLYFIVPIFETTPTWFARFPYLCPPETGWPSYTPRHWVPFPLPLTTWWFSNRPPHGLVKWSQVTLRKTVSLSWCQAPISDPRSIFLLLSLIIFIQLQIYWCVAPSLTRSRVCSFQLLLSIAGAVFLGSESYRTYSIFQCL